MCIHRHKSNYWAQVSWFLQEGLGAKLLQQALERPGRCGAVDEPPVRRGTIQRKGASLSFFELIFVFVVWWVHYVFLGG